MTPPTANAVGSPRRLRIRQTIVIALLFGGYASLYFCRADLSVAAPLLAKELVGRGFSYDGALVRIGAITSLGILAYAIGKPFVGGLGDYWGGRINFLVGLAGATLCTLLFAVSGALPIFTMAWFLNRLTQSGAWAGLLKVSSRWFDYSSHGAIIGVLSLSDYRAYRRFAMLLREPRFMLRLMMRSGDLIVFDNQRILHGRTGFASARYPRHLQGCYLTRDSVFSRAALLAQGTGQETGQDTGQETGQETDQGSGR